MIQRLSHVSIYVLDQDAAYDFYVNRLGFEVRTDQKMDNGFRWLTVGPQGQPGLEIVLMPTTPSPMMDQATSDALCTLIRKGVMGAGVFQTADCKRTYEEL
jgi:catechol 2,3-dioxygenase-like lactoylglutathione lyase family enzyme